MLSALSLARKQEICLATSVYYGSQCMSVKSLSGAANTFIDYEFECMTPGVGAYCYVMAMSPFVAGATCKMEWQYVGFIKPDIKNKFRFLWGP